jgi:hypothetical protein
MLNQSLIIKAAFLLVLQNVGLSTSVVFVGACVLFRTDPNSLQVGRLPRLGTDRESPRQESSFIVPPATTQVL